MRPEAHLSVVEAEVRQRALPRHRALRLESGRAFAIAGAQGPPRLWGLVLDAALAGFERVFEETHRAGAARLQAAVEAAQEELSRRTHALVEHTLPDAILVSLLADHDELHVMSVGASRVYLQRRGQPQRLTPREDPPEGLREGTPVRCSVALEPGDVVLAGSVSAFSVQAVAKLASVLEADPRTPPSVLATLLTEPAAKAGVGAAGLVLRVR